MIRFRLSWTRWWSVVVFRPTVFDVSSANTTYNSWRQTFRWGRSGEGSWTGRLVTRPPLRCTILTVLCMLSSVAFLADPSGSLVPFRSHVYKEEKKELVTHCAYSVPSCILASSPTPRRYFGTTFAIPLSPLLCTSRSCACMRLWVGCRFVTTQNTVSQLSFLKTLEHSPHLLSQGVWPLKSWRFCQPDQGLESQTHAKHACVKQACFACVWDSSMLIWGSSPIL